MEDVHWIPPIPESKQPPWFRFELRWIFYSISLLVLAIESILQLEPILKRLRDDEWYVYSIFAFLMGVITGVAASVLIQITFLAFDPDRELSSDTMALTALLLMPASFVFWFVFMAATTSRHGTHLALALCLLCVLPVVFIVWTANKEQ